MFFVSSLYVGVHTCNNLDAIPLFSKIDRDAKFDGAAFYN